MMNCHCEERNDEAISTMQMRRLPRSLRSLAITSAVVLSAIFAHAAEPKIILSSSKVVPGDTLRIILEEIDPKVQYKIRFRDKTYPAYPIGVDAQRTLIGIALGSTFGTFPLEIKQATRDGWKLAKTYQIEVSSIVYATENVNFSAQKTALMKLDHQESARIGRMLKTPTAEQQWEGDFDPPIQGKSVGEFGVKRLANGTQERGFHKGVDLEGKAGTPILAANSGTVAMAYPFKMHGRTVIVNHGQGIMTIYLHMKMFNVKPGQKVRKGEILGQVGSTGLSTAPHVHWGLYVHGVAVNPQPWLENEF